MNAATTVLFIERKIQIMVSINQYPKLHPSLSRAKNLEDIKAFNTNDTAY